MPKLSSRRVLATALLAGLLPASAPALGTAFTYQGRLSDGAAPANGTYDFEFRLYAVASGGVQVGSAVSAADVAVASGLFTVTLDFGAAPFDGNDRWLEVGVRPGASSGAFSTLTPRQALAATPYSRHAANAATLGGVAASGYVLVGSVIPIGSGGTGATTADGARASLGAQAEITGSCPPSMSIRDVNGDGTVVCAADSVAHVGFARTTLDSMSGAGQYTSLAIGV